MPRHSLVLSSLALHDLLEIREYVRRDDPGAAEKLVALLDERLGTLASYPQLGKVWEGEYRVLVIQNHLAFYMVTGNAVQVRRVVHGARGLDDLLKPFN